MASKEKIFIVGDSRTGTLSVSNFLQALGFKSIHYYEDHASMLPHTPDNHDENVSKIIRFVTESGYEAFSDYPTRIYYKELAASFPDACFILTTRKSLEVWKKSMVAYFSKYGREVAMQEHIENYLDINEAIRNHFNAIPDTKFIEICIDEDMEENSELIKNMLSIESESRIGWDNRSADIDNSIISSRLKLYNFSGDHIESQLQKCRQGYISLLSEYGWIFLINEPHNFTDVYFGANTWSDEQQSHGKEILNSRISSLEGMGIEYLKFIIPEKIVIYPEYLPKTLAGVPVEDQRPAKTLAEAFTKNVFYLDAYLKDAKSYGFSFFRGGSHVNWLGAYLVYQFVMKKIYAVKSLGIDTYFCLKDLHPTVIGYDGDLFDGLSEYDKERLKDQWEDMQFLNIFEHVIQYELPANKRKSTTVSETLPEFPWLEKYLISEIEDSQLPKAVIFLDQSMNFLVDLISEHFRRAVFIWGNGDVFMNIIESERPDVVLHFMSERSATTYGTSRHAFSDMDSLDTEHSELSV